jgi:DNA-binding LytR/AlgR family response regulator
MNRLRVAVAEDEPLNQERMVRLLKEAGCEVVATFRSGTSLLAWLDESPAVDALFLDIRMPGVGGLEVLRAHGRDIPTVLATAFPDHALEAFDGAAVDYLLKPVSEARLAQALARLNAISGHTFQPVGQPPMKKIPVKGGEGTLFLDYKTVSYFQIDGSTVYAVPHTSERMATPWKALVEMEGLFPDLIKIHRNLLVRRDSILGFRFLEDGRLLLRLQGGMEVESSRPAAPRIRSELGLKREKPEG